MCAVKNILFCVLSNSLLLFCFNFAKKKKKEKKKISKQTRSRRDEIRGVFSCANGHRFGLVQVSRSFFLSIQKIKKLASEKIFAVWGHSKSMFAQDSRVSTPPSPLVRFRAPPLP